jgi:hypothetical protein
MVAAEHAPQVCDWFCTLEQQWHLNSCMETSYDTIPWWIREEIDRAAYYDTYQRLARGLMTKPVDIFGDGRPYFALHARRADRGQPVDEQDLLEIVASLAEHCRDWVVISDGAETGSELRVQLERIGCRVAQPPEPTHRQDDPSHPDRRARLLAHFDPLRGAEGVVSSVRGGWSAFPYAATRLSGAPLIFTEPLEKSVVWRVLRAHSQVPIRGVHHGRDELSDFRHVRVAGHGRS